MRTVSRILLRIVGSLVGFVFGTFVAMFPIGWGAAYICQLGPDDDASLFIGLCVVLPLSVLTGGIMGAVAGAFFVSRDLDEPDNAEAQRQNPFPEAESRSTFVRDGSDTHCRKCGFELVGPGGPCRRCDDFLTKPCSSCGRWILTNDVTCPYCGADVKWPQSSKLAGLVGSPLLPPP